MKRQLYISALFSITILVSCGESSSDNASNKSNTNNSDIENKRIKDSLNLVKENEIKEKISQNIWLNKNKKDKYQLAMFNDSSFSFVNYKGSLNYTLAVDTLKFQDKPFTTAVVSFNKNGDLLLKSTKSGKTSTYSVAKNKDKFIGSWTGQLASLKINLFKLKLNPDGKGSFTDGNGTYDITYTHKKNKLTLNIKSKGAKINLSTNFSKLNKMSEKNSVWTRKRKSFPNDLSDLMK